MCVYVRMYVTKGQDGQDGLAVAMRCGAPRIDVQMYVYAYVCLCMDMSVYVCMKM